MFFYHNEGQPKGKRGDEACLSHSFLSIHEYKYIANFFKDHLNVVSLTGGEPTLISNFPDIIRLFKNSGYTVKMTSNAFLLDNNLQLSLKDAGIDSINVSLSTLDSYQHSQMFRIKNKFQNVSTNLINLSKNFPNKIKINFMALPEINIPKQLLPISDLSAKLGIRISFLTKLNNGPEILRQVLNYLMNNLGVRKISEENGKFGKKLIYTFNNNAIWEFDDFRQNNYKELAFSNKICSKCKTRQYCVEGPYALRISYNGCIRPCLIRSDNIIPLTKQGYFNERS